MKTKIVKMLKFENRIKSKMLEIKIVKIELNQKSSKCGKCEKAENRICQNRIKSKIVKIVKT